MKPTHIHIGENIQSVMNEKGMNKATLARLLDVKPQSVDYLLKRKSIDTDTLYNVSLVLDFDFFKFYRINQANSDQINFDVDQSKVKVLVEVALQPEDIIKLKLKNKIIQILDK